MALPSLRRRLAVLLGAAALLTLVSITGRFQRTQSSSHVQRSSPSSEMLEHPEAFNISHQYPAHHGLSRRFEMPDEDTEGDPADNNDLSYQHGNPHSGVVLEGPEVDDQTWTAMVQKGKMLMSMMETRFAQQLISEYTQKFLTAHVHHKNEELWGWTDESLPPTSPKQPSFVRRFQNAFQKLNIDFERMQHVCKMHTVDTSVTTVAGPAGPAASRTYPATDAIYEWYMNTQQGVITNLASFGPRSEAEDLGWDASVLITMLQYWADLTYLSWQKLCNDYRKETTLTYVFVAEVTEHNTKSAIKKVFQKRGIQSVKTAVGQDHFKLNKNDEALMGLLGSPLCQGVAFMLAQHKDKLGHKIIDSIDIWDEEARASDRTDLSKIRMNIMFTLRPLEKRTMHLIPVPQWRNEDRP